MAAMVQQQSLLSQWGKQTTVQSEPVGKKVKARVAELPPANDDAAHPVLWEQVRLGRRGRVPRGSRRGVRAGRNSNRRQTHETPLRREPSLGVKLAVSAKVDALVKQWGGERRLVPRTSAEFLEKETGWQWKRQMRSWWENREALALQLAKLKIGIHGLRPFGSGKAQCKRESKSMGCRIKRKKDYDNYQSAVLRRLRSWFEYRRMHGLEVRDNG